MQENLIEHLHLYAGHKVNVVGYYPDAILCGKTSTNKAVIECEGKLHEVKLEYIELPLRPISKMTDEELLHCGKLICAIPNSGKFFSQTIKRGNNSLGITYTSPHYTSDQYFLLWNENNKPETIGHIEVGWTDKVNLDKTDTDQELWKIGGCHELTAYLLKQGIDLLQPLTK